MITSDSNQDDKEKSQIDTTTVLKEKKNNSIKVDGEKKSSMVSEDLKRFSEEAILLKMESSKRKLQQGYEHAAKKQHLVKVLNMDELPKEPSHKCLSGMQRKRTGTAAVRKW
ncbi:hypothetical protein AQUCO_09600014v1 [Aquilegia coerulea]|uniref:Uncharacterized protein n=1 Tax=Aquilegia coerulea TaxID=218851 RepID=A0A2G5C4G3_AQUCA|nr:hypothetical protein AQUCO_09600014v1 [Aquilegia coerulea]